MVRGAGFFPGSDLMSRRAFFHGGYLGMRVIVDPEYDLVSVFLTSIAATKPTRDPHIGTVGHVAHTFGTLACAGIAELEDAAQHPAARSHVTVIGTTSPISCAMPTATSRTSTSILIVLCATSAVPERSANAADGDAGRAAGGRASRPGRCARGRRAGRIVPRAPSAAPRPIGPAGGESLLYHGRGAAGGGRMPPPFLDAAGRRSPAQGSPGQCRARDPAASGGRGAGSPQIMPSRSAIRSPPMAPVKGLDMVERPCGGRREGR
jgi:hypothetical protein